MIKFGVIYLGHSLFPGLTWTLDTPQTRFAFLMAAGSSRLPWINVILEDFWASFLAEAELMSRVTARILKEAFYFRGLLIREPPFPVAPVTRIEVIAG